MNNTPIYDRLMSQMQGMLEEPLIREMSDRGTLRHFAEGDLILDRGEKVSGVPMVLKGSVKVLTEDAQGNDLLLYYLELGDTCATTLNCCSRDTPSAVKAIAEEVSEILFLPGDVMESWLIRYPTWRAFILESYNIRLREMLSAIDTIVFHNMEERLTRYLRDKAWISKSSILKISHQQIADDLYSSRVVISRLMKKLEKESIIKQSRNQVEFLEFSKK